MATIANLNVKANDDSDSENDPDFIPDNNADNDSDDFSDDNDDKRDAKRVKAELTEEEKVKQAQKRASLWAEFEASVQPGDTASSSNSTLIQTGSIQSHGMKAKKLVKIEKRYRFAGEDVVEVVEVPEDSEDAKKWSLWSDASGLGAEKTAKIQNSKQGTSSKLQYESNGDINIIAGSSTQIMATPAVQSPNDTTPTPPPTTTTTAVQNPKQKFKPKPPKPSLFSSLSTNGTNPKPKQLTTFQKSAMDWRAHIASEEQLGVGVKDELEANRREGGGGYLEKVEFLERVGQRREEIFESAKSSKRRRK